LQPLLLQPAEEETVAVGAGPTGLTDLRDLRFPQWLPGPVLPAQPIVFWTGLAEGDLCLRRPGRPVPNPLLQVGDWLRRELLLRRHLGGVAGLAHGLKEQALFRPPRDDCRPTVAALEQAVTVIDAQAAAGIRVGGVAVVAVVHQQRANLLLEEFHAG